METFDAIVIGTGGAGSAALFHLAKRGLRVLGLDQFPWAHLNGSSHGQSRIIRQAYFEHPNYVPLLLRAYELWDELERESARKLFYQVGLLEVGPSDGILIPGVLESVEQHNLPIERLSVPDARQRFPFEIDESCEVLFEPTGGYLLVEECVRTHLEMAKRYGAEWRQEKVVSWSADNESDNATCTVRSDSSEYQSPRVVFSGGAWSGELLHNLNVPLRVVPKIQYWFEPKESSPAKEIPTYFFETPAGCFYGFPQIDERGFKVAQHTGGEATGPVELDGISDDEDLMAVIDFKKQTLPFCSNTLLSQQACMYTFSPDEHFIVDRHPSTPNVVFAAGLSGHGFKFTTVLGELLATMAMQEDTATEADFLRLSRLASD